MATDSFPPFKVGVVGATGAVGRVLLERLASRHFPVGELRAFASPRSQGYPVAWRSSSVPAQVLAPGCFDDLDVVFFDASDEVSRKWVPLAAEAGAWVIDNSGAFRMDADIDLLVPEVNGFLLEKRLRSGGSVTPRERILAGPNCSTVQLVMALKPLHDRWGLKRVVVSSYQATSGAGLLAMGELAEQTRATLDGGSVPAPRYFAKPIAFNTIPHIGGFDEAGVTSEERKIQEETRKILGLPHLKISATAVRVPTLACHSETVNIEFENDFDLAEVREALAAFPGVRVMDQPTNGGYPTGLDAAGRDEVFVGRLRRDPSHERGLNLWVVSDNLVKGAALNAVQIAEMVLETLQ